MVDGPVDLAILAVSMVAVLLGITMLAGGEITALAPIVVGILGFAYLKTDLEQVREGMNSWRNSEAGETEEALAVLRSQYASGEIDRGEFERKLGDLLETETVELAEKHQQHERGNERE